MNMESRLESHHARTLVDLAQQLDQAAFRLGRADGSEAGASALRSYERAWRTFRELVDGLTIPPEPLEPFPLLESRERAQDVGPERGTV